MKSCFKGGLHLHEIMVVMGWFAIFAQWSANGGDAPSPQVEKAGEGVEVVLGIVPFGEIRDFKIDLTSLSIDVSHLTGIESSCRCLEILAYPTVSQPVLRGRYLGVTAGETDQFLRLHFHKGMDELRVVFLGSVSEETDEPLGDWTSLEPSIFLSELEENPESLLISYNAAMRLLESGATLIDVRQTDAYIASHIHGALNLPPHRIASSSIARQKKVIILTGPAFLTRTVTRILKQLRAQGNDDAWFLPGGPGQWGRRKGRVVGEAKSASSELTIAPEFVHAAAGQFAAIKIGGDVTFLDRYLLPEVTWFPEDSLSTMEEFLKDRQNPTLLFVPAGLSEEPKARSMAASSQNVDAWVLQGGIASCEKYLAGLSDRVRRSRDRHPRVATSRGVFYQSSGCRSCPDR